MCIKKEGTKSLLYRWITRMGSVYVYIANSADVVAILEKLLILKKKEEKNFRQHIAILFGFLFIYLTKKKFFSFND